MSFDHIYPPKTITKITHSCNQIKGKQLKATDKTPRDPDPEAQQQLTCLQVQLL